MVYIRPSAPVVTPTAVKPLSESSNTTQEHPLASETVVNEYRAASQPERRKPGSDRRQQRKDSLLETRAGKDRRKNKSSINISI